MFLTEAANRGSISTGYDVDNSVKLEDSNNEWLYRASPTAGNRKTYTFSFWIKRSDIGLVNASGNQFMIGQGQHGRMYFGSDYFQYRFDDGHDCRNVSRQFRDTSAWYHFVVSVDTNQSSSSNRVKLYVNGESLPVDDHDGGSYPDIQDSGAYFSTSYLTIGTAPFGGSYNVGDGDYDMSGYLAEFCGIDGTAYAPTDFGEFSDDGIWIPKDVSSLTFGSEGFYLNFSNASNLGEDFSGNDNDFTSSNLAAADQSTDTPTNNFCTLNPLWTGNTSYVGSIREGATILRYSSGTKAFAKASMGVTNGKWYWEAMPNGTIGSQYLGIHTDGNFNSSTALSQDYNMAIGAHGAYYSYSGSLSETSGAFTALTTSNVIGVVLDLDSATKTIKYYKDGSLILSLNLISNMQDETIFPFIQNYENRSFNLNFGGYTINTISSAASDANGYGTFEYAPPSGYYALCTKNLAEYG
jgi:hypothetical protein|tara:strand:+ start:45 stop:1445 length:1401 start_codon:yes stop_codon:yes gene_type:complete